MHIIGNIDGSARTEISDELLFVFHHIDLFAVDLFRSTTVVSKSAWEVLSRQLTGWQVLIEITVDTVVLRHSLLTLDELDVGLFDDIQLHLTVICHRLIPRHHGEMVLQVLRLELPAVTRQDLIAHQAQLSLGETSQIGRIEQHTGDDITHGLLLCPFLLSRAVFDVVGCQHECMTDIAIGLTDGQEVHAILTDVIDTPP